MNSKNATATKLAFFAAANGYTGFKAILIQYLILLNTAPCIYLRAGPEREKAVL